MGTDGGGSSKLGSDQLGQVPHCFWLQPSICTLGLSGLSANQQVVYVQGHRAAQDL